MNSPVAELIYLVHGSRDSKFFLTDLKNSIQYQKFHVLELFENFQSWNLEFAIRFNKYKVRELKIFKSIFLRN